MAACSPEARTSLIYHVGVVFFDLFLSFQHSSAGERHVLVLFYG